MAMIPAARESVRICNLPNADQLPLPLPTSHPIAPGRTRLGKRGEYRSGSNQMLCIRLNPKGLFKVLDTPLHLSIMRLMLNKGLCLRVDNHPSRLALVQTTLSLSLDP